MITHYAEAKITRRLLEKFAVVFDGWSENQTQIVGIFATFPGDTDVGYSKLLLGFSPFEHEDFLNAYGHVEDIDYVLNLFNGSFEKIVGISRDNCSVNRSIARKLEIKFVGYASHRYNLALKDLFVS